MGAHSEAALFAWIFGTFVLGVLVQLWLVGLGLVLAVVRLRRLVARRRQLAARRDEPVPYVLPDEPETEEPGELVTTWCREEQSERDHVQYLDGALSCRTCQTVTVPGH